MMRKIGDNIGANDKEPARGLWLAPVVRWRYHSSRSMIPRYIKHLYTANSNLYTGNIISQWQINDRINNCMSIIEWVGNLERRIFRHRWFNRISFHIFDPSSTLVCMQSLRTRVHSCMSLICWTRVREGSKIGLCKICWRVVNNGDDRCWSTVHHIVAPLHQPITC